MIERARLRDPAWWTAVVTQLVALLSLAGALTPATADVVLDAATKALGGLFVVLSNVYLIYRTVHPAEVPPTDPPAEVPPPPPSVPAALLLVAAGLLLICGLASAAEPLPPGVVEWDPRPAPRTSASSTPTDPEAVRVELACLFRREQQLRELRQQNAQVLEEIRQLRADQQRLLALLEGSPGLRSAPQSGPIIVLPSPTPPRIDLPIGGSPRIDLPIPGNPRIDLPAPGSPRIDLPPGGSPRIDLGPGGAPKLDPTRPPSAPAPGPSATPEAVPISPGEAKPVPSIPGMPKVWEGQPGAPKAAGPGGYMTYTLARPH